MKIFDLLGNVVARLGSGFKGSGGIFDRFGEKIGSFGPDGPDLGPIGNAAGGFLGMILFWLIMLLGPLVILVLICIFAGYYPITFLVCVIIGLVLRKLVKHWDSLAYQQRERVLLLIERGKKWLIIGGIAGLTIFGHFKIQDDVKKYQTKQRTETAITKGVKKQGIAKSTTKKSATKRENVVINKTGEYIYNGAAVAEGYGGPNAWNIQPINPRTSFSRGMTVYVVAQARNVKVNHRWCVVIYRNGEYFRTFGTQWYQIVDGAWLWSSFYPAIADTSDGKYQCKIYLDIGKGFELVDIKDFFVS